MGDTQDKPAGPDLSRGVATEDLVDGAMLAGHVGDDAVLLVRRGREFLATDATCTHYGAPLADGLVVGDTVRCPWHHACFSLRTGEALHAPALAPIGCWSTEVREGKVFVRAKVESKPAMRVAPRAEHPRRIVIVGGGAAGFAAAQMLRLQRYDGEITMVSDDDAPPVDRPNLSKDYLAGNAPEAWIPLRGDDFYRDEHIDLRLSTAVTALDVAAREATLRDGTRLAYDRLLLATGAEPVRLAMPGMEQPHVFTLRTLADCRAIIARAAVSKRGRDGRELHRARGRRVAAGPRARRPRRCAGQAADGARAGAAGRRLRARPARGGTAWSSTWRTARSRWTPRA